MGSRTWIKIYCDRWLNGSIREETPEVRGIWVDLLVLAGSGKYGDSGEIKITDQVGFLDKQLADLLQISVQKWVTCKEKLIETDRVCVKNRNIIAIINWSKYQSEYNRQRVYRQSQDTSGETPESCNKKLQPEVTTKSTARERDKRIEIKEETKVKRSKEEKENTPSFSSNNKEITLQDAITAYQENINKGDTISEDMETELKLACDKFPPYWVVDAIMEAAMLKTPRWARMRSISNTLKDWGKFGKPDSH